MTSWIHKAKLLGKCSLISMVGLLSACESEQPVESFTLPASEMLTTENHTTHSSTGLFDFCEPTGGTGSIGRIFRLKKGELLVGWDHQFNPSDCETSIVDWYRGAVRFSMQELNQALKGKEPLSVELHFKVDGQTAEHHDGKTVATNPGKNMLCSIQIEIAKDHWPEWVLGTHSTIKGNGNWVTLPEGEVRNFTQGGVKESENGYVTINVTKIFRDWRTGDKANMGFVFRTRNESNADKVKANDVCLTNLSDFTIRVITLAEKK